MVWLVRFYLTRSLIEKVMFMNHVLIALSLIINRPLSSDDLGILIREGKIINHRPVINVMYRL